MRRPRLISSIILLLLVVGIWYRINDKQGQQELSIDQLYYLLEGGQITEMVVDVDDKLVLGRLADGKSFTSRVTNLEGLEAKAVGKNVKITVRSSSWWESWLLKLVVLYAIVMIGGSLFLGWLFRKQGQQAGLLRRFQEIDISNDVERPKEKYGDIAGCRDAIYEIREMVAALKDPERFKKMGIKPTRGILLVGPPGTGKTLIARATANEADLHFISLAGSDFNEMFVGVGAQRVRDAFKKARKNAPSLIFIDDLDGLARRRLMNLGSSAHEERENTLVALLTEMDGMKSNENIIIMGATNNPMVLDPAILRPNRFDRKVTVLLPDLDERLEALKIHIRNKPLADDVDLLEIAKGTPGASGADLMMICNEAALYALSQDRDKITRADMNEGIDKTFGGKEKKRRISREDRERVAYHEAGHTLVAKVQDNFDNIRKVTIRARGLAGGITWRMPNEERRFRNKEDLKKMITFMLGGRAAEEVQYTLPSDGARADLLEVTKHTREMVCELGMSEKIGLLAISERAEFMGISSDNLHCSPETARLVDQEMKRIADECYNKAKQLLIDNKPKLDALVAALLEKEDLIGDEIDAVIKNAAS